MRDRDTVLITRVLFRQLREPQIATLTWFWSILLQQIQHFPHNIPFEVLNGFLSVLSMLPLVAQISHFSHSIPSEAGLLDYDLSWGPANSFVECMLSITCLPKRPELMHIYAFAQNLKYISIQIKNVFLEIVPLNATIIT